MHFRGRERHTVDAKGRTSMSARFRELLHDALPAKVANHLVLVPWFGECVRVYPVGVWDRMVDAFEERLSEFDGFDAGEDESDLRRVIYGGAIDVHMDGHGRLVLPKHVREEIGIEREVYWVGAGRFLELWDPDALHARLGGDRATHLRRQLAALGRRRPEPEPVDGADGGARD